MSRVLCFHGLFHLHNKLPHFRVLAEHLSSALLKLQTDLLVKRRTRRHASGTASCFGTTTLVSGIPFTSYDAFTSYDSSGFHHGDDGFLPFTLD
jgi:hypothetical protein